MVKSWLIHVESKYLAPWSTACVVWCISWWFGVFVFGSWALKVQIVGGAVLLLIGLSVSTCRRFFELPLCGEPVYLWSAACPGLPAGYFYRVRNSRRYPGNKAIEIRRSARFGSRCVSWAFFSWEDGRPRCLSAAAQRALDGAFPSRPVDFR